MLPGERGPRGRDICLLMGVVDNGDLLLFFPTNEGVAAGGGNVRRAAVRQETEA